MGFGIDTWNEIAGPIYMGANTSWESTWTIVSAVLCVLALVVGSAHEKSAYRREEDRAGR